MEILGVHHVQITVLPREEERARHFYCEFLDLPEIPKPIALRKNGGFWLQVGRDQVHVGVDHVRPNTKAHVAYAVKDLAAWRTRLIAHGVPVVESLPIPRHDRFEFHDPFGNRVEMIEAHA